MITPKALMGRLFGFYKWYLKLVLILVAVIMGLFMLFILGMLYIIG